MYRSQGLAGSEMTTMTQTTSLLQRGPSLDLPPAGVKMRKRFVLKPKQICVKNPNKICVKNPKRFVLKNPKILVLKNKRIFVLKTKF